VNLKNLFTFDSSSCYKQRKDLSFSLSSVYSMDGLILPELPVEVEIVGELCRVSDEDDLMMGDDFIFEIEWEKFKNVDIVFRIFCLKEESFLIYFFCLFLVSYDHTDVNVASRSNFSIDLRAVEKDGENSSLEFIKIGFDLFYEFRSHFPTF